MDKVAANYYPPLRVHGRCAREFFWTCAQDMCFLQHLGIILMSRNLVIPREFNATRKLVFATPRRSTRKRRRTTPGSRRMTSLSKVKRYRVPRWMPYGRGLIQSGRRYRYRLNRRTRLANRIRRLGVTDPGSPRFYQFIDTSQYSVTQGTKRVVFPITTNGMNSKDMLDALYTSMGYTQEERGICIAGQVDQYTIANQSNGGVYVKATMMRFIRDHNTGYNADINVSLIQEGFNEANLNNSGNQLPMTSIFQNKKLMRWMQPVKSFKFFLAAGGVRKLTYSDKRVKRLTFRYKQEPTINHLKGETILLIECHGTPVHDDTTPSNIDIAGAVLDIYKTFQVKYFPTDSTLYYNELEDNVTSVTTPVRFIDNDKTEVAVATSA